MSTAMSTTMSTGDFVKCTHITGNQSTGRVVSNLGNEITIEKNNKLATFQKKYVSRITKLSHKSMNRNDRIVQKRTVIPRSLINISEDKNEHTSKTNITKGGTASLYLLSMGNDYYKVGYTRNIKNRLKSLKTASISKIDVIKTQTVKKVDVTQKEATLKAQFANKFDRSNGGTEIFHIPNKDAAIRAFKLA